MDARTGTASATWRACAIAGALLLLALSSAGTAGPGGGLGEGPIGGGPGIQHAGIVLSALAPFPPMIDGHLTSVAGEWDAADFVDLEVNVPEGGTVPGRLYEMNDADNLYLAVRFERTAEDPVQALSIEFDNDHDGGVALEEGDDGLVFNPLPFVLFRDEYRTSLPPCPPGVGLCGIYDTDGGGTNDGAGAYANDGTYSGYELFHPLDTTDDAKDFSLGLGRTVGFGMFLNLGDGTALVSTILNEGDIVIPGAPGVRSVDLEVKPETLNLKSEGRWVTARLNVTGETADAVDLDSLALSGVTVAWAHILNETAILAKFDRTEFGATLAPGEFVEVTLTGLWSDGAAFAATDVIRVIRPGP